MRMIRKIPVTARERAGILLLAILVLAAAAIPHDCHAQQQYSMEFKNVRVDTILRALADKFEANISINGSIEDTISVNLSSLDLPASLQAILAGSSHTWEHEGDVLRILPRSTTTTRMIPLRFTDATSLASTLDSQFPNILINAETHSNSLILSGPLDEVRQLQGIIDEVDHLRKQVSIEAEMIEISLNESDTRGVDLSAIFNGSDADAILTTSFSQGEDPATLEVGVLNGDMDFAGILAALVDERNASLLSSPSITTLDNQPASIHVGERVPYQKATTETTTGATLAEIDFMDVGVKLTVTPTISRDNSLYLEIHSEVSEVLDQSVQNVPRIGTREADTRVLIRSGDVVAIGGLIKNNRIHATKKVPLLGSIPVLGWLFRRDEIQVSKTELVIFIHPRILEDPSDMLPNGQQSGLRQQVSK